MGAHLCGPKMFHCQFKELFVFLPSFFIVLGVKVGHDNAFVDALLTYYFVSFFG